MNKYLFIGLMATVLLFGVAGPACANLISNGTFDTDLAGWDISGTLSTTWDSQTAHVGRPGTPGLALFSQSFNTGGASALLISFDYQWQENRPDTSDIFRVYIGSSELYNQDSNIVAFGSTFSINETLDLTGLSEDLVLTFELLETPNTSTVGTRIQLDNVSVTAVPIPSAAWILGTGLIGLLGFRRRMRN